MKLLVIALAALPLAVSGGPAPSRPQAPEVLGGYLKLGFDLLSGYKFIAPEYDPLANPKAPPPTGEDQIPATVKSWNGKKAIVTGFMLPTKLENGSGKAIEFLLMANQMACCYGTVPNMNDWVIVKIPKGVPITQDVPISFRGTFRVSATFESGYMTGIYALDAEGPGQIAE
ncbi:MAG TPA: DUF3299 domain-containing protein [Opitutaceae bacterium]|nr:DUF3299 domain-containing protein [Opitutaceae bacterium]